MTDQNIYLPVPSSSTPKTCPMIWELLKLHVKVWLLYYNKNLDYLVFGTRRQTVSVNSIKNFTWNIKLWLYDKQ